MFHDEKTMKYQKSCSAEENSSAHVSPSVQDCRVSSDRTPMCNVMMFCKMRFLCSLCLHSPYAVSNDFLYFGIGNTALLYSYLFVIK